MRHLALATLLTLGLSTPAAFASGDLPPLRDVPGVRDGLIDTAIAWEIGRVCPTLSARMITGIFFLKSIESYAAKLGYSREEIDTFVNSDTEKAALEVKARARLAELGGVPDDAESHCAVGRAQIAQGTQIGKLLR